MDLGSCLKQSWETFTQNPIPLIIGALLIVVANAVVSIIAQLIPLPLSILVSMLPAGFFVGGLAIVALKAHHGLEVEMFDVFDPFINRPADFLVMGLVIQSGAIACGIGVIVTYVIFFFAPLLVAKGSDYRSALGKAKDITFNNFGEVLALSLIVALLNIAGTIACGFGLLVSLPVSYLMIVNAYDQLDHSQSVSITENE